MSWYSAESPARLLIADQGPLRNRVRAFLADAEELVRRIHAREDNAFDDLYLRYSRRVFGFLYQRLNGNVEDAEDLTADVFTRVYEKIDTFQVQGAPLSAWLFRIARNRLIDSVRRRAGQAQVGLDDAPQIAAGRWIHASFRHRKTSSPPNATNSTNAKCANAVASTRIR